MATLPPTGLPTGTNKLEYIKELVNDLTEDLKEELYLPDDRAAALDQLKVLTRDPTNADPLYTEEGISTLLRHAYDKPTTKSADAARRVLANAMVLKPITREIFVNKGFAPKACQGLNGGSYDDEFLNSRILFLSTYGTNVGLKSLIDDEKLADRIVENLARHAKESNSGKAKSDPMQDMALVESAKLLFNVTHFCPDKSSSFTSAIPHLVALLLRQDISQTKPLDPPVGFIVNALANLDVGSPDCQQSIHPEEDPEKLVSRLISILDAALKNVPDNQLDATVTPLVGVIKSIYEHAPNSSKKYMRDKLLPTQEDRKEVLGKGDALSAKLLQNFNNPLAPSIGTVIQHLLYDLSDNDANKFVENVGYGFASGFLFQNNIPIPPSASDAGSQKPVNPVTGQHVDAEKPVDEPEMTEEEKEREAERLFVLFERLKKTGIVDIQNPVEAAVREGRYRELKDDEVEEIE
ncbi:guanine nucleotide exchange factor synembryn [Fusarium longipes]|uniref:Guanine nucleotide exchange factor synembryn n=1 Tax=Fusarium longipes TaxID=694270 RepID=A0A395T5A3_9HYPO|nr:guanine nucleotide exchange factor synembryn [Fusarium longipes]